MHPEPDSAKSDLIRNTVYLVNLVQLIKDLFIELTWVPRIWIISSSPSLLKSLRSSSARNGDTDIHNRKMWRQKGVILLFFVLLSLGQCIFSFFEILLLRMGKIFQPTLPSVILYHPIPLYPWVVQCTYNMNNRHVL